MGGSAYSKSVASTFENVTVVVRANVYFDGRVASRALRFADGAEKTLGLMQPGAYDFGADKPELMEITAGRVKVRVAGEDAWTNYAAGDAFNVPGASRLRCSFLDG